MAYKIIVSVRAQKEIENAINYYSTYSVDAFQTFITILENSYNTLATSPFFRIWYKNIRGMKIKKFPYSLYLSRKQTKLLEYFPAFIIN